MACIQGRDLENKHEIKPAYFRVVPSVIKETAKHTVWGRGQQEEGAALGRVGMLAPRPTGDKDWPVLEGLLHAHWYSVLCIILSLNPTSTLWRSEYVSQLHKWQGIKWGKTDLPTVMRQRRDASRSPSFRGSQASRQPRGEGKLQVHDQGDWRSRFSTKVAVLSLPCSCWSPGFTAETCGW